MFDELMDGIFISHCLIRSKTPSCGRALIYHLPRSRNTRMQDTAASLSSVMTRQVKILGAVKQRIITESKNVVLHPSECWENVGRNIGKNGLRKLCYTGVSCVVVVAFLTISCSVLEILVVPLPALEQETICLLLKPN